MDRNREFAGQTVLITGAGKGIGYATAILMAERGAHVVALSRSQSDLDLLSNTISCKTIAVDLADSAATLAAARQASEAQPIDLLVNCAGIAELAPFLETSVDAFDITMAVNVRAAMVVAQEYARGVIARGTGGAIVNVSSMAAQVGTPLHSAYCASKAALDALTRVMAVELGVHGIRVNTVNPVIKIGRAHV